MCDRHHSQYGVPEQQIQAVGFLVSKNSLYGWWETFNRIADILYNSLWIHNISPTQCLMCRPVSFSAKVCYLYVYYCVTYFRLLKETYIILVAKILDSTKCFKRVVLLHHRRIDFEGKHNFGIAKGLIPVNTIIWHRQNADFRRHNYGIAEGLIWMKTITAEGLFWWNTILTIAERFIWGNTLMPSPND